MSRPQRFTKNGIRDLNDWGTPVEKNGRQKAASACTPGTHQFRRTGRERDREYEYWESFLYTTAHQHEVECAREGCGAKFWEDGD